MIDADTIIAAEVANQGFMWGEANERTDVQNGELLGAGLAQLHALYWRTIGSLDSFDHPPPCYPADWSGFRDYGSDIANLAVAAAFIRNEIARKLRAGESSERTSRNPVTQPYTGDQPNKNKVTA